MTALSRRPTLLAAVAVSVGLALASVAPAAAKFPPTRTCANVTVLHKGGTKTRTTDIRATGTSCARARVVVRACLRKRLRGWALTRSYTSDERDPKGKIGLDRGGPVDRGGVHISYEFSGPRGCA